MSHSTLPRAVGCVWVGGGENGGGAHVTSGSYWVDLSLEKREGIELGVPQPTKVLPRCPSPLGGGALSESLPLPSYHPHCSAPEGEHQGGPSGSAFSQNTAVAEAALAGPGLCAGAG